MVKKLSGLVLMIVIFLGTLELTSFVLLKTGVPRPPIKFPDYLANDWDVAHIPELARLSTVLQSFRKEHPEIPSLPALDMKLYFEGHEFPARNEKGSPAFPGITPDMDDIYVLKTKHSKREKYRVRYVSDKYGFRVIPDTKAEKILNVIFLGCSFTWGEGVDQDENFPSQIAISNPEWNVINAGASGASAAYSLSRIQEGVMDHLKEINRRPTVSIFTFIDDHMFRSAGASSFLSRHPDIMKVVPYYVWNGKEFEKKKFSDDPLKWLTYFYGKSHFASVSKLSFPYISDQHLREAALLLLEIKKNLHKKFPGLKHFVVAGYPGEKQYFPRLKHHLKDLGVTYFDYSEINIRGLLNGKHIIHDGHPSPIAYALYGKLLEHDIQSLLENRK